jgi:hypothetical protein
MKAEELYSRESYPISHGNWENRWKVSINTNPDRRVRWTVKTNTGIKDLDSQVRVELDTYYYIVGAYDGSDFDIYINGNLDNHSTFSGSILTTNIDLMIGQVRPDVTQYNFNGVIDDVRIYDYALSVKDIQALYLSTKADFDELSGIPKEFALYQNYPNPFNPQTTIRYQLPISGNVKLDIVDLNGKLVQTIVDEYRQAGRHTSTWNARDVSSGIYFFRLQVKNTILIKKCIKLK